MPAAVFLRTGKKCRSCSSFCWLIRGRCLRCCCLQCDLDRVPFSINYGNVAITKAKQCFSWQENRTSCIDLFFFPFTFTRRIFFSEDELDFENQVWLKPPTGRCPKGLLRDWLVSLERREAAVPANSAERKSEVSAR